MDCVCLQMAGVWCGIAVEINHPNRASCGLQMSSLQVECPVGLYLGLGLHS